MRRAGPRVSRGKHSGWETRGSTQRTSLEESRPASLRLAFSLVKRDTSEPVAPWQTGGGTLSMKQNQIG